MKLRRFNNKGVGLFEEFLYSEQHTEARLASLLMDPELSGVVSPDVEVAEQSFTTRLAVGEYLHAVFDDVGISNLDSDEGIWTWLSGYYFEQLCPLGSKPGAKARWVPAGDYRQYYRHLLRGPYQIYRAHRDCPHRALAVLANAPHQPGEIAEQLVSRQDLVTNASVMEVATGLYIDPDTAKPKTGAAGSGSGSARRLPMVLDQLDLIWDLYRIDPSKLMELLPEEFDRFKP